jgi:predicted DNA-binding protein
MSLISLRLPDDLTTLLNREAKASKRSKAEIARAAIADYLNRQERERFMAAYVRSIANRDPAESLAIAEEFLPLENEALALAESGGRSKVLAAWDDPAPYGAGRQRALPAKRQRTAKRRAR